MAGEEATGYAQELVAIVQLYRRGGLSRRGFLDRAAKCAVGGLATATLLERMPRGALSAQRVRQRRQRVAVVGTSA